MTYEQILRRLEQIEQDLEDRQLTGEQSAADFYRAKAHYEQAYAKAYMATDGAPTERKQATLLSLMKDESYKALVVAEASYEGWRAAMRTLEARSMIGMALLKASVREAPQGGPQPAWSNHRRVA